MSCTPPGRLEISLFRDAENKVSKCAIQDSAGRRIILSAKDLHDLADSLSKALGVLDMEPGEARRVQ